MVKALVELNENTNHVLNMVKAKYQLQDKGKAIELVVTRFMNEESEPELKHDFVIKMSNVVKQKSIKVDDFAKRYLTL